MMSYAINVPVWRLRLANSEQEKSDLREALKALQQTRADDLFELERQKRQLYGRSSGKVKSLKKLQERSVKEDKDDFDGFNPPGLPPHEGHALLDTMRSSDALVGQAAKSKPHRSDYGKNATQIESTVMHYCNRDQVPADARPINVRHWILYKMDWNVCKHVFEIPRLIDSEGAISNYYAPFEGDEALHPFENVLPGHHVGMDMIAQIMVDKYQYSLSSERGVARFSDAGAKFSSSTVLSWIQKHTDLLGKQENPLRNLLLSKDSFCSVMGLLNWSESKTRKRERWNTRSSISGAARIRP